MAPISRQNGEPLLVQVEFEVFGTVQGVNFTKFCKDMSDSFGLKGWTKLSKRGTVIGVIQGEKDKVDEMVMWLKLQGSPGSRIEHCELNNWRILDRCDYKNFSVRF